MEDLVGFIGIEQKAEKAVKTNAYLKLIEKLKNCKRVYLLGNGGLHYVASHMSTDLSRLVPEKTVFSFDSVGFITSNANDYGYGQVFVRWLETTVLKQDSEETLVIGLSCSGNSSNVIGALHWAEENKMETFLISGQKSNALKSSIDELSFECDYFHTVEVLCMILFYDMIHKLGSKCPDINSEKERLKDSNLRKV